MTRKAEMRAMSNDELWAFTNTLSTKEWRKFTEKDIADIALFINSDGCTGVPDFYLDCCIIHDWFYATHRDFNGNPKTKAFADKVLEECIRKESWLGKWSPMAWWRWQGVKHWANKAWEGTN